MFGRGKKFPTDGQLAFEIDKVLEKDRNHSWGGRSFYFFDFDENIAFLDTQVILIHKRSGQEFAISGREFALCQNQIGQEGRYKEFELVFEGPNGSFRNYRDRPLSSLSRFFGGKQTLIKDIGSILSSGQTHWQGPSWPYFYHAVFNRRPLALITARGHAPETLKEGIRLLVKAGHLPYEPNYLGVYPVNYAPVTQLLSEKTLQKEVAELKKRAIRHAFAESIKTYGNKPHRFGMSDDDPKNISLISQAMRELKTENPHISFFVIDTSEGKMSKTELEPYGQKESAPSSDQQLKLDFPMTIPGRGD